MGRQYGNNALRRLRQHRLEVQRGQFGQALEARGDAAAALSQAETLRRGFELREREAELRERARFCAGSARIADFATVEAWRHNTRQALEQYRAAERDAKRALRAAIEHEGEAQRALVEAEAAAKAVERDYERWQAAQRCRAERTQDDELDERWAPRASAGQARVKE